MPLTGYAFIYFAFGEDSPLSEHYFVELIIICPQASPNRIVVFPLIPPLHIPINK